MEELHQLVQRCRPHHVPQIVPGHWCGLSQHPTKNRVTLCSQDVCRWDTNAVVAAMRTAQVQKCAFRNSHRQFMCVFAEFHHAQVHQQFADVQSGFQDTQGADIRVLLEHRVDGLGEWKNFNCVGEELLFKSWIVLFSSLLTNNRISKSIPPSGVM